MEAPHTLGFLMGFAGFGALLGAGFLASKENTRGLLRLIPVAAGIFGTGLIAFSQSRTLWLSYFLMLVTGLGMVMQMASCNTVIQTINEGIICIPAFPTHHRHLVPFQLKESLPDQGTGIILPQAYRG